MKNKFLQYTLLCCSLMILFSACRKDPFNGKETNETGKTFVYITEADGDPYIQFFDVFSDVKPVVIFTVRRDAASKADLQKAITVTLTADPDSTNNSGLTPFTTDLYATPSASDLAASGLYASSKGVTQNADGSVITVSFAAGEFAKNIIYKIDGSKLDLSNTYGSVYKITNLGGFTGKAGFSVVAAGIAVKNAYDGVYAYTGELVRNSATGPDVTLGGVVVAGVTTDVITSGPVSNNFSFYWATGGGIAGIDHTHLTVDPATNLVTVASDNATMHSIGDNYYDPSTKEFHLNVGWGVLPNTREAHVVLSYAGPR